MAPVSDSFLATGDCAPGPSHLGTGEEWLTITAIKSIVGLSSQCMKGARIRYQQTGGFHFLTFSCYRRRSYFSVGPAMELFENALERVRLRYQFVVAGYVVMPEHIHLLVNEPARGRLSTVLQALKLSVSMRSRQRPFWQAHYYDSNVGDHKMFVNALRYIHRNPVVRGLVVSPEDWKWSSFRHYQTGVRGTVEIESEWTARARGSEFPVWMRVRQTGSSISPVPKSEGPGAHSSVPGKT